ncbi:MAG: hypothetical protein AMXMBFR64_31400 [Myxococcales bacterium]
MNRALLVIPVLAAAALAIFELHNDDTGFHLATGRYIRDTGTVPDANPFTYIDDGHRWVQHQWIPAVGMSLVADTFGVKGLVVTKALVVALAFGVLAFALWRLRTPPPAAALLLAVAVAAGANRFYERPYLLSMVGLTVTTTALLLWRQDPRRRAAPWVALAAPAIGIHLHAGALDSVLVWGAFVAGLIGERALGQPGVPVRNALAFFTGLLVAMPAGLLLEPGSIDVLTLPLRFGSNAYWHEHLVEFRPLPFISAVALQWVAVAVAVAALVAALWRRRLFEALLVAGFVALALRHLRMAWPMAMVAAAVAGALLSERVPRLMANRLLRVGLPLGAAALLLVAWTEQSERFQMGLGDDGIDGRHHALAMMDRAAQLPGRHFVSDGLAGTWLWRVFRAVGPEGPIPAEDQRRVLIHNDLECYTERTYIDVYQHIRYGKPGWDTMVADLGIRTFLLKHTSPGERRLQEGRPNLRQHLFASSNWVLVDFDDSAAVWTAATGAPPDTLRSFPVDPDTGEPAEGARWRDVRGALLAHAAAHLESTRSARILLRLASRMGDGAAAAAAIRLILQRDPAAGDADALLEQLRALSGAGAPR